MGLHSVSAVAKADLERDASQVRNGHVDMQWVGNIRVRRLRSGFLLAAAVAVAEQGSFFNVVEQLGVQQRLHRPALKILITEEINATVLGDHSRTRDPGLVERWKNAAK